MYYVSFTDDHTRYTHITLLAVKLDTFDAYKAYEAWAKTQHSTRIKCLRSDHGGEYLSNEFTTHLKLKGTEQKVTTHDTPQHNGVVEQLNHMLMERIRAVGHASGLLKNLWGEVLIHVVWVKNQTASRVLNGKTSYELLTGNKLNLHDVSEWGACMWVHDPNSSKLDMQARDGRWVGFNGDSGAHRIYCGGRITIKCNLMFDQRKVGLADVSVSTIQHDNTF